MNRVINFSAGPSALPAAVMQQAQQELCNWQGHGVSVMEISHRDKDFVAIAEQAEHDLRDLLAIPDHYQVLFLQGGARAQFGLVPLNILGTNNAADYVNTGLWSQSAIQEAKKYCQVSIIADATTSNFTRIPSIESWQLNPDAAYVHYTPNETVGGLEFHWTPDVGAVPLVADMSSNILSRPINIEDFGLIYAGAQKNIGPAGLTIVIVRDDLMSRVSEQTPSVFNYKIQAENQSMYNTPPTFAWYLAGLVFKWLKQQGGMAAMELINRRKADKLYAAIDESSLYNNIITLVDRSWMNIPFRLINEELEAKFLQEAKEQGFLGLKGHRSVGGIRASMYNAITEKSVDHFVGFMKNFEKKH